MSDETQEDGGVAVLDAPLPDEPIVWPKSRRTTDEQSQTKKQPPYAVIVHNDDEHTFQYVIEVLMKLFGYPLEKAFVLTNQVHVAGKSVVWTGALEVAELKRDQLRGFGPDLFAVKKVEYPLGVTIEPLPE